MNENEEIDFVAIAAEAKRVRTELEAQYDRRGNFIGD